MLDDIFMINTMVFGWVALAAIMHVGKRTPEVRRLQEKVRTLEAELARQAEHCQQRLAEAGIRNVMMTGLWRAFVSGGLKDCIATGGQVKVLSDGAVICEKEGDSHVITK